MKKSLIVVFPFLVSLGCATDFVCCQPLEVKPDDWRQVLRNDPRLKSPLDYQFPPTATSGEVFAFVHKATGVSLSLAGEAEKGKVILGSMAGKAPAWMIMTHMANNQFTDGKWEKTGDRYVLHGALRNPGEITSRFPRGMV